MGTLEPVKRNWDFVLHCCRNEAAQDISARPADGVPAGERSMCASDIGGCVGLAWCVSALQLVCLDLSGGERGSAMRDAMRLKCLPC